MGLFNFSKPKWQHPDFKIRMEAVKYLSDKQLLYKIAICDESSAVRQEAIKSMTDQNNLAEIAKRSVHEKERFEAVKKLVDQDINAHIAKTDESKKVRQKALENIKDQRKIAEIVRFYLTRNADSDFGFDMLTDINVLVDLAKQDFYGALNRLRHKIIIDNNDIQQVYKEIAKEGNTNSRVRVFGDIKDDSFLETIAQTDDDNYVRLKATECIKDKDTLIKISRTNSNSTIRQVAKVRSCQHNFDNWDPIPCCIDYPWCDCDPKGQLRCVCSICGIVAYKRIINGEEDIIFRDH